MTRAQFIARAVKAAERSIKVPPGWWGTWRDITNGVMRVRFHSGDADWRVTRASKLVSRHALRASAISRARK